MECFGEHCLSCPWTSDQKEIVQSCRCDRQCLFWQNMSFDSCHVDDGLDRVVVEFVDIVADREWCQGLFLDKVRDNLRKMLERIDGDMREITELVCIVCGDKKCLVSVFDS